jgi:hypothetical protein
MHPKPVAIFALMIAITLESVMPTEALSATVFKKVVIRGHPSKTSPEFSKILMKQWQLHIYGTTPLQKGSCSWHQKDCNYYKLYSHIKTSIFSNICIPCLSVITNIILLRPKLSIPKYFELDHRQMKRKIKQNIRSTLECAAICRTIQTCSAFALLQGNGSAYVCQVQ